MVTVGCEVCLHSERANERKNLSGTFKKTSERTSACGSRRYRHEMTEREPDVAPGDAVTEPQADSFSWAEEQVYRALRRVAGGWMKAERRDHTLQPTALVHEAYLRLADQRVEWKNRSHFLGVAAGAMRRVLLDHARARGAAKRPDALARVTLSGLELDAPSNHQVLALEAAMAKLAKLDPRAVRVVEMRGFAGCTAAETAEALGVSLSTVERDWRMGRSWLRRELSRPIAEEQGDR